MKYYFTFLSILMLFSTQAFSQSQTLSETEKAQTLIAEYQSFLDYVRQAEPEGTIDGFTQYKNLTDNIIVTWYIDPEGKLPTTLGVSEPIDGNDEDKHFHIEYHHSSRIIELESGGQTMAIRRIIRVSETIWRADTVDLNGPTYLTPQGHPNLPLSDKDKSIFNNLKSLGFGITLFE